MISLLLPEERLHKGIKNSVRIDLYATGKPLVDYTRYNIYLRGLKQSMGGSGNYLIVCCSCGYAFCDAKGEYITTVVHHRNHIEWIGEGAAPPVHYFFDKEQYIKVVNQLANDVHEYFSANRGKINGDWIEDDNKGLISVLPNNLMSDWLDESR